jgi:uncharacterized oligopeptide transporter (OPT) family protein
MDLQRHGSRATIKLAVSLAFLMPGTIQTVLPFLPKAELAVELAPALLGVGFILGYRRSGVLVAGSVVSALVLTPLIAWIGATMVVPLYPEPTKLIGAMSANEIWTRYVRYIGAGAVAAGGVMAVVRGLPTMAGSFMAVARGVRRRDRQQQPHSMTQVDRDCPVASLSWRSCLSSRLLH